MALGLALEACSSGSDDATTGKRVVLQTRVEIEPSAKEPFITAVGFEVTLEQVLLATGPLYYFDGAPPLVFDARPSALRYAWNPLRVRAAHAHPGHYQEGNAMGQMLEPSSVDLLDGTTKLATGAGITGTFRSARFTFVAPPEGPLADELEGHVASVRGLATKTGVETRYFQALADLEDVARSAAQGQVEGCEFSEVTVAGDGRVTLRVNPKVWFALVDFTAIEAGSKETPSEFPAGSQPKIAFAQGLAQLSAYKFSYSNK